MIFGMRAAWSAKTNQWLHGSKGKEENVLCPHAAASVSRRRHRQAHTWGIMPVGFNSPKFSPTVYLWAPKPGKAPARSSAAMMGLGLVSNTTLRLMMADTRYAVLHRDKEQTKTCKLLARLYTLFLGYEQHKEDFQTTLMTTSGVLSATSLP